MFLTGLVHQLESFARSRGVEARDVHVLVILEDGEQLIFPGLKVVAPASGEQWGMLLGGDSDANQKAVSIREETISRVEFRLKPEHAEVLDLIEAVG